MITSGDAAVKRSKEKDRACRVHKVTPRMYRAINNSKNDDGGGFISGAPTPVINNHRRQPDPRTIATPRHDPAPAQRDQKAEEMITSIERVFSVPGTRAYATLDTQNECTTTSVRHTPRHGRHLAFNTTGGDL